MCYKLNDVYIHKGKKFTLYKIKHHFNCFKSISGFKTTNCDMFSNIMQN